MWSFCVLMLLRFFLFIFVCTHNLLHTSMQYRIRYRVINPEVIFNSFIRRSQWKVIGTYYTTKLPLAPTDFAIWFSTSMCISFLSFASVNAQMSLFERRSPSGNGNFIWRFRFATVQEALPWSQCRYLCLIRKSVVFDCIICSVHVEALTEQWGINLCKQ